MFDNRTKWNCIPREPLTSGTSPGAYLPQGFMHKTGNKALVDITTVWKLRWINGSNVLVEM